jgi:circadian clock protein KaiB
LRLRSGRRRFLLVPVAAARPVVPPVPVLVMTAEYLIKLYVTGQTPRSLHAISSLRQMCESELGGRYEMVVIDVLEHPQLAEDEKILATPTVVKELPQPIRRIIGDLSDTERVLLGLDLRPFPLPDIR